MRSEGGAEILWRATRMYGGRSRHGCRGGCLDERGLGRTCRREDRFRCEGGVSAETNAETNVGAYADVEA
eukprot:3693717-Pyramimonas_sp.AAC.1